MRVFVSVRSDRTARRGGGGVPLLEERRGARREGGARSRCQDTARALGVRAVAGRAARKGCVDLMTHED